MSLTLQCAVMKITIYNGKPEVVTLEDFVCSAALILFLYTLGKNHFFFSTDEVLLKCFVQVLYSSKFMKY